MKGESADLVIHNARIHTMADGSEVQEAIAIKDGKVIEIGAERQILNKYNAEEYVDAQGKDIYPGWTDAHGHIMSYARQKLSVDLVGCTSYEEMIIRIEKYQSKYDRPFIIGRGWDQSLWEGDEMPTNEKLNEIFPDIPVCLFRIDGHALLANDYLIEKSDVIDKFKENAELNTAGHYETYSPTVIGYNSNKFTFKTDIPTGVFVDNAMNPILDILPDFPEKELKEKILDIQAELFSYGLTGVHEAGVSNADLMLLDKMVNEGTLTINLYAMLLPTPKNIEFAKKNGHYRNKNLYVRSFKVYGDGALGSRGACLKKVYTDKHEHHGYLTTSIKRMNEIANLSLSLDYQMNTHAIGDSTNKVILDLYKRIYDEKPDHRWRIEHVQIVDPNDFQLFAQNGVFPSIQPTHATSDQRWAVNRLGEKRMNGAYAYKTLIDQFGMAAIGTDFPVEYPDPFRTIHSAVHRQTIENFPMDGFMPEEAITMEQCIKGMTIWAAISSFQEDRLGTLEKGKDATFTVFDKPVNAPSIYTPTFSYLTVINGKKVYSEE